MVAIATGQHRVAPAVDDLPPDAVARVGAAAITRGQLDAALRRGKAAAMPAGPQRQQAEAAAVEGLVEQALLRQAVAQQGVAAEPAAVEAQVEKLRSELAARGIAFADFLTRTGQDEANLREQIALELAVRQFVAQQVTSREVEAYFKANRRELDGTLVRVSHIVLRPDLGRGESAVNECLDRARDIRSRILQGELTFAAAARAHSAGPSRRQDGDLGFIPRRGVATEEFARQAFTIAKGDISQPFATPAGVHLLSVTNVEPGRRTLAALQPQIEQTLAGKLIRDTIAAARQGTSVTYAPGVPHFDPATTAAGRGPRRVIVGPGADEGR